MRTYLKELRTGSGKTQQAVADALNISQNYYSYIENGKRNKELSLRILFILADFYGVDLQDLVNEEAKYMNLIETERRGA